MKLISLDLDRVSISYWEDGRVAIESDENIVEMDKESALAIANWILSQLSESK